jgi:hypothetical protein
MSAALTVRVPNQSHKTPMFSDQQIKQIADGTSISIAKWVRATAEQRGVALRRRTSDKFARAASRLSDAEIDLDPIEELLVALRRSQVITPFQRGLLQVYYLR